MTDSNKTTPENRGNIKASGKPGELQQNVRAFACGTGIALVLWDTPRANAGAHIDGFIVISDPDVRTLRLFPNARFAVLVGLRPGGSYRFGVSTLSGIRRSTVTWSHRVTVPGRPAQCVHT